MKTIHIAIGSTMSRPGDVKANVKEISDFARHTRDVGGDLLLTPELSASGYGSYPEVLATAERAGKGRIYETLAATAQKTGVVICAGFVEASEGKRHLSQYVIYPSGKFLVQRKFRVTLVERPLDPADPGQPQKFRLNYFEVRRVRCGIAICADLGIDQLNETLAKDGIELLLGPSGAGGKRKDRVTTKDLYSEKGRVRYLHWLEKTFFPGKTIVDCLRYRRGLAAVNQCGDDGRKHSHLGHGMIINPMGEVAAFFHGLPNLDRQRPMFAHAEVDLEDRLH